MEIRLGVCSCFVIFATFLSLAWLPQTAHAQRGREPGGLRLTEEPERVYYVSKKVDANITCEALGATAISFTCASAISPDAQRTYESYDEARRQNLVRSSIQVTRAMVHGHQRHGRREDYWCMCQATNEDTREVQQSRRTIIRASYMRKHFQQEPMSQTVSVGSSAVFRCVPPEGEPTPEIIWRKDGRRITGDRDNNFVIRADNSLTILAARQQDAGSYECIAKNLAFRRTSTPADLTVEDPAGVGEEGVEEDMDTTTASVRDYRPGELPIFLEKPDETIYIPPEKSVLLVCDTQGADRMSLQCNRQRIPQERLEVLEERDNKRMRIVYNLTYADVENYINSFNEQVYSCECVAWYRTSREERGWSSKSSNSSNIYLASLEENFEEEPPRNITIQVGTTATLPCKPPMGKPSPWVYWKFNDERLDLRSNPRYRMEGDGSLIIQQLEEADQGQYLCVAQNVAGFRQSRLAYLTVSSLPVPSPGPSTPVFVEDLLPEYYLNTEGKAHLTCSVIGAQQLTFQCSKGRLDENEQNVTERISPDQQASMLTAMAVVTYEDVVTLQAGNYTCQCVAWYIQQEDWKSSMSTNAVVKLPYLDGEFMYEPKGGVFAVGDSAELACQPPDGVPKPKIFWLKDGYPLRTGMADSGSGSNNNRVVVLEEGVLMIESIQPQDAGQYVCFVNNSAGERASAPVSIEVYDLDTTTTAPPPTTPPTTTISEPSSTSTTLFTTTPYYPGEGETTDVMMGRLQPIFTMMPEDNIFIPRGQPAVLRCGAMQVSALEFYCNGEKVQADDKDLGQSVNPTPGLTFLEKSIEVTRDQVLDFAGPEPYLCQCRAYYETKEGQGGAPDYMATDSIIQVAYIRRKFEQAPESTTAQAGERTELVCVPPKGVPEPLVYWLKDGFRLENSNKMYVSPMGSLIFEQIEPSDAGDYTCAAENLVSTRFSDTVHIEVMTAITLLPTTTDSDVMDLTTTMAEPEGEVSPEGEGHAEQEGGQGEPETTPEGQPTGNEVEVVGPDGGSVMPMFMAEPESMYYIVKSKPVTIFCQTKGAERITFDCNDNNIPQSQVHYQNNIVEGEQDVLMASIEVSRDEVETYNSQMPGKDYHCQCHAQYSQPGVPDPQQMSSSKGYVQVAYLRKMFILHPENTTTSPGAFVALHCQGPEGNPPPEIKWMKDGEEVYGDYTPPDKALVFQSVSAANAGVYYCVAANLANMRTSYPAAIVLSGEGDVGEVPMTEAPAGEGLPEIQGGDNAEHSRCVDMLKVCSAHMPQSQADQGTSCHTHPLYKGCLDDFLQQCSHVLDKGSLESALQAQAMVDSLCQGESACPELLECHAEYKQTSMPDLSAETMPTNQLCEGIESFLRCADDAMKICNISRDHHSTSLLDVVIWFQQYCERVSDGDWEDQCSSLTACQIPTQQAVLLPNMVEVSKWCSHIQKTVSCTTRTVQSCAMDEDVQDDLDFLAEMASVTCPEHQGGGGGGGGAVGEEEGGAAGAESEGSNEVGVGEGGGREPGKSLGHDDGDDGGNSAESARASVLLTSLLSVLFVLTVCR